MRIRLRRPILRERTAVSRRRHTGERGLTLVEMVVTVAVIGIGVVGIAAGIAATEKISAINQDEAQLELQMRQATDYIRDSTSLPYILCANTTTNAYTLPNASWAITAISESPYFGPSNAANGGSRNGAVTPPIQSTGCATNTADWGVQEIMVKVSSSSRSLTRTVWKSDS